MLNRARTGDASPGHGLRHAAAFRALGVILTTAAVVLGPAAAFGQYVECAIPVGGYPVQLLWNPVSNKVYCSCQDDCKVYVIDGASNQVIATVDLPELPVAFAWNSRHNKVYVSCGDADRVAVIDGYGDTLLGSVRIRGYPNRMAYCETLDKLYVCRFDDRSIEVLDAGPDTAVAVLRFWGFPGTLEWHPTSNRVFCSLWADADTVAVIDCVTDEIASFHPVGTNAFVWARSPVNDLMYHGCRQSVYAFSADGESIAAVIPAQGRSLWTACFAPYPNKLYVGEYNWDDGYVTIIDCSANEPCDSFQFARGVQFLACDTVHGKIYVGGAPDVQVRDAATGFLLTVLRIPGGSYEDVVWNRVDSRVYLVNYYDPYVYVIRDTSTGVTEQPARQPATGPRTPSVVGRWLDVESREPAVLVDIAGRPAALLHTGRNDVSQLVTGIYFLRRRADEPAVKVIVRK